MQYEPIKKRLGKFISGSVLLRKVFYLILGMLLLRSWHIRKALRRIAVDLQEPVEILDAGCGMGQYSWIMSNMNKRWKIDGIDINKEEVEGCRNFFQKTGLSGRVSFNTSDLTEFRKPGYYNLILSVDVMEHIEKDEQVFRNFYESLNEKGILIISTPSDKGGSGTHDTEDNSFIDEHVRNGYGIQEISDKLARAGFGNTEIKYTYGKAGNLSWNLSMKYPIKMVNISYLFLIILPFYYIITCPFSLILNFIDVSFSNNTGTGLLVTARKNNR